MASPTAFSLPPTASPNESFLTAGPGSTGKAGTAFLMGQDMALPARPTTFSSSCGSAGLANTTTWLFLDGAARASGGATFSLSTAASGTIAKAS
uniref:Uncharacterized protein n=1 Tax=Arundo donax TaxID=35708 RepID=A0A0A9DLB6_ARUDO